MKAQTKIIGYQIALVVIIIAIMQVADTDVCKILAMMYGGFISVMTSVVMAVRLNQAVRKLKSGSRNGSLYVYLGVIERLFIAVTLFSIGFLWLELSPVYTVIGLITGQIGFMIGGFRVKD